MKEKSSTNNKQLELIKKKRITIDDLAIMMDRSFTYLHKDMSDRFAEVDKRFALFDERFERIDQRFDQIDGKFDASEDRFKGIEYRIATIEQNMATKEDIKELDAHIGRFERRFQKIEEIVLQDHRPRIRALEIEAGI